MIYMRIPGKDKIGIFQGCSMNKRGLMVKTSIGNFHIREFYASNNWYELMLVIIKGTDIHNIVTYNQTTNKFEY
jgi:hypothetical protein